MNKITIKDIARMLSISVSTVSRALADHPDISSETKIRVKEVAEKFNYLPNLHARFFRKKNTKLIALIIPEFNRFFFPDLIQGIQSIIDQEGYSLIIFQSRDDAIIEAEIIKYCMSWVVEGVLITLSSNTNNTDHLKILKESNIPVVIFDKIIPTEDFSTVTIDDIKASYSATKHLLSSNKKKVLGIFAHENLSITKNRLKGFFMALEEANIEYNENNYIVINKLADLQAKLEHHYALIKNDALFIMTDELLVNSLNFFLLKELKIPRDLSVVSISDGSSPHFLFPKISHIFHSGYAIGKAATELMFENINAEEDKTKPKHIMLNTTIEDLGSI